MGKIVTEQNSDTVADISFADLFNFLKKRLVILIQLYILVFALLVFGYLFLTPKYKSDAVIQSVAKDNSALSSLNPMAIILGNNATASITTDIELLSSRRIIDALIQDAHLQFAVTRKRWVMATYLWSKVQGPQEPTGIFYVAQAPQGFSSGDVTATENGYILESPLGKTTCQWDTECSYGNGTIRLNVLGNPAPGTPFSIEWNDIIDARKSVKQSVSFTPIEGTKDMIKISYSSPNPFLSQFVVTNIIKQFARLKHDWDREDAQKKQEYISETLGSLKKDIDKNAEKLISFQKETDTFMPSKRMEISMTKLLDTMEKLDASRLREKLLDGTISRIKSGSLSDPIIVKSLANDPSLQQMLISHNELIFKLNQLSRQFTDEHPLIKELKDQIGASKQSILASLNAQKKSLHNVSATLLNTLNLIVKEQKETPERFFTFASLKRDLTLSQKLYTALAGKMFETSFDSRGGLEPVRVVDQPTSHVLKASPRTSLFLLLSIFLSAFLALGIVLLQEFFRTTLFATEEIKKYLPSMLFTVKKDDEIRNEYSKVMQLLDIKNGKTVLHCHFTPTSILTPHIFFSLPRITAAHACYISFDDQSGISPDTVETVLESQQKIAIAIPEEAREFFLSSEIFSHILTKAKQRFDIVLVQVSTYYSAKSAAHIATLFDLVVLESEVGVSRIATLSEFGTKMNNRDATAIASLIIDKNQKHSFFFPFHFLVKK